MDTIRTARLLLRRARIEDVEAFHAILSDQGAMRYWSTPPHESMAVTRAWVQSMIDSPADASEDFVIELEGRVIGKAGCWRVPEIGYILHPGVWGQGFATEALQAILPRVFARFDVPRLTADVDPRNTPSLRLLAGLGFVETHRAARTWNVGGEWCDSVYLALSREGLAQET